MAMFRANCGHQACGATHVSVQVQNGGVSRLLSGVGFVDGFCPHCNGIIVAHLARPDGVASARDMANTIASTGDVEAYRWMIIGFWPETPSPSHPEHIPDGAARAYLQAERNRAMRDMQESAATSYRRALDIATKAKDPTPGRTLNQRIEALAASGNLTQDLKDWAHEIRAIGNDGAHEDGAVTSADVEDIRTLTELVLTYLFTLPTQLQNRRDRKLADARSD